MNERRLPCGCYAEPSDAGPLVVTSIAFLCDQDHRQGDVVEGVEVHPDQITLDDATPT